jgi:hypothetical protein
MQDSQEKSDMCSQMTLPRLPDHAVTCSTPPTPLTGDNLVRARRTYQMTQVKTAIDEWWKSKTEQNEIDVEQARQASRKIMK